MPHTRVETEYKLHVDSPELDITRQGITMWGLDAGACLAPESIGLSMDTESILSFVEKRGADPAHFAYAAIGIFGSESPYAKVITPSCSTSLRDSFVRAGMTIERDDGGIQFPVIGLRYDTDVTESRLNHVFRHELSHLLQKDRPCLYNRPELVNGLKIGALATAFMASDSWIGLWEPGILGYLHAVEDYSAVALDVTLGGLAGLAMLGAGVSVGLARNSYRMLWRLDRGERQAEVFARRHQDFKPIRFLHGAEINT